MGAASKDSIATIAAIGLVAYVSADVAHHVLGHGGACLALHGQAESISSVYVKCSVTGGAVDLAGPIANLIVGVGALLGAHLVSRRRAATHLICALVAAFNLFWFSMQLAFSAATKTDDWAWTIQHYHVGEPARYVMIGLGAALYMLTARVVAHQLAPFAQPIARVRNIALTTWITGGAIAVLTAAFDRNGSSVILRSALPQSLLLSIGLLFAPARAARSSTPDNASAYLNVSIPWIVTAAIVGGLSVAYLGPGFAVAF